MYTGEEGCSGVYQCSGVLRGVPVQWGAAVLIEGVYVGGGGVEQGAHDVSVPHLTGAREGRVALEVQGVDGPALPQQQGHGPAVARSCRRMQRCTTGPAQKVNQGQRVNQSQRVNQ